MTEKIPSILVNGEPVPPSAVEHELARLVDFYSSHMPRQEVLKQLDSLKSKAVDQAIGSKLLFMEAEKRKIEVPQKDVDKTLFAMAKDVGGMDNLRAKLKKQGLTESVFRAQIARGRRVDILVESVVGGASEPTEEEAREHFDLHKDEYSKAERVLAQHILITPKGDSPEAKEEARKKLSAIRQRVLDGADFGDEATKESDCPSGKNGGSLGWFSRGMMVPPFEKAAFDLKVGDVSDIVETQFGFHLIYKTDHEEPSGATFEESRESIRDFLYHSKRGELLSAFVAKLRESAKVEITE